jgi:chromosome segregation ATPase
MQARREELLQSIAAGEQTLDEAVHSLEAIREDLRAADEAAATLRAAVDAQDATIRDARQQLEGIRAEVSTLDIARATAESDLTHLGAILRRCGADDPRPGAGGCRRDGAHRRHNSGRGGDSRRGT